MAIRGTENQISVTLPPPLRPFIEQQAEADGRTLSGMIRVWVTEKAKSLGWTNGTAAPWPPPAPIPEVISTAESIAEGRAVLATLTAERDRLAMAERAQFGLMPQHEARLRAVRDYIHTLERRLEVAERLMEPSHG
jgi:hypothetical protein